MSIYQIDKLWVRKCPDCGKEITYTLKQNAVKAQSKKCKTCCKLGDKNPFYHKTHSEKTERNCLIFASEQNFQIKPKRKYH